MIEIQVYRMRIGLHYCRQTKVKGIDHLNYFEIYIIMSTLLTLRLHYVPGDHGSHGSPKRSAPCDCVNFCLGTQVLLSIITFRHGLSRYPLQTVG